MGPLANFKIPKGQEKTNVLKWIDEVDTSRTKLGKGALRGNDLAHDLLKKKTVPKIMNHH